jgi:hypothetical protein
MDEIKEPRSNAAVQLELYTGGETQPPRRRARPPFVASGCIGLVPQSGR